MNQPIHVFSGGLWKLRHEVGAITGLTPRRAWLFAGPEGAVAGWGHKPTARRARAEAQRRRLPYIAFEDGFLRSLRHGPAQKPISLIADRSGIYYDARGPSDLETLLASGAVTAEDCVAGAEVAGLIAGKRLSKYNSGSDSLDELAIPRDRPVILVVDQTFGDQSVEGGLAGDASFARMYEAAVRENPGCTIIAKLHPEVVAGTKRGYLLDRARSGGAILLAQDISPWALFALRPKVYTVSSQLGFEALMAGLDVVCFGVPFYSHWGLTDDRVAFARRGRRVTREELAGAVYIRYSRYFDAWRRTPVSVLTAIDQLDFLRRQFLGNATPIVCHGIARWKRRAVTAMLDGPKGKPRFIRGRATALALARKQGAAIAAWGETARQLRDSPDARGLAVIAIEDGFVRSAGLGAAFVQPLSLVFDSRGIYYDAMRPSDLEHLLATMDFDPAMLQRAASLRRRLIDEKVTKYNLRGDADVEGLPEDRDIVLVPGQVADDWAVRLGSIPPLDDGTNVNEVLLAAAQRRNPDALVIFKPHPDVVYLGRRGALTAGTERGFTGRMARSASLEPLLALAGRVETWGSLAGFEALLRGLPVAVHGVPFYAGWGLTEDLVPCPRRGRKLSLDALTAAALIVYPRYWDPLSGLACPPEMALDRLGELRNRRPALAARAAALAGRAVILWRRLGGGREGQ